MNALCSMLRFHQKIEIWERVVVAKVADTDTRHVMKAAAVDIMVKN